ncbi:conserved hypothetical protein [Vibrio owensii]|uniref:Uncharacterized protein n=1 Tax=Vibrio owensii TaxID=696485 RepID=A0AAU9QDX3_9VIBR|nr:conserved hypothetical protein [Vibrio owensii]
MKNECCYEMARDIFICHLGMSEGEAEAQVARMFNGNRRVAATSPVKALEHESLRHLDKEKV